VLVGAKKLRIIPTKRIAFFWRKGHGEAESCLVVEIDGGEGEVARPWMH
jgi:hypothetical protein